MYHIVLLFVKIKNIYKIDLFGTQMSPYEGILLFISIVSEDDHAKLNKIRSLRVTLYLLKLC